MAAIQLSFLDRLFASFKQVKPDLKKRKAAGTAKTRQRAKQRKADPMLLDLWLDLKNEYFPEDDELSEYRVYWSSRRQKRTLASCNLDKKTVSVARELNFLEHHKWLKPLLYHEMCHAHLKYAVAKSGQRTAWHGPEFKRLEARNPATKLLDQWIKAGGWQRAVRSHRAREAHRLRRKASSKESRAAKSAF